MILQVKSRDTEVLLSGEKVAELLAKLLIRNENFTKKKIGKNGVVYAQNQGGTIFYIDDLVFVVVERTVGLFDLIAEIKRKISILEETGQVLLIPPESAVPNIALNIYMALMIAELQSRRETIECSAVIDCKSGTGVLSLVALKLGAVHAFLIDSDLSDLGFARKLLQAHGWSEGESFTTLRADLKNPEGIAAWLKERRQTEPVIGLANIGPWQQYGKANEMALQLLTQVGATSIINTGYFLSDDPFFRGQQPDWLQAQSKLKRAGFQVNTFKQEVGQMISAGLIAADKETTAKLRGQ